MYIWIDFVSESRGRVVGQRGRRKLDKEIYGFLLIVYLEWVVYLFGVGCIFGVWFQM